MRLASSYFDWLLSLRIIHNDARVSYYVISLVWSLLLDNHRNWHALFLLDVLLNNHCCSLWKKVRGRSAFSWFNQISWYHQLASLLVLILRGRCLWITFKQVVVKSVWSSSGSNLHFRNLRLFVLLLSRWWLLKVLILIRWYHPSDIVLPLQVIAVVRVHYFNDLRHIIIENVIVIIVQINVFINYYMCHHCIARLLLVCFGLLIEHVRCGDLLLFLITF